MSERLFSVRALNEYVAALFAGDPLLRQVRVQGEISGFKPAATEARSNLSNRYSAALAG